jgi:hypothetical protein
LFVLCPGEIPQVLNDDNKGKAYWTTGLMAEKIGERFPN